MPNIGDYVNYGNQGVCRIDGRRSLKFGSAQPKRDYYILSPVYQKGHCQCEGGRYILDQRPETEACEIS